MTTLGSRLKLSRKQRAMTQKDLSEKSGVSQQLISRVESEKIDNTTEFLSLAEALGVSAKWLSKGEGEMTGEDTVASNSADALTYEAQELAKTFQKLPPKQQAVIKQTIKAFIDSNKSA